MPIHPAAVQHARRGITLVELLFVVLIIVVIVGILLPARGGSGTSPNVVSQSSMRSLTASYSNYAEDYNDWIATLPLDPAAARKDAIRILAKQTGRNIEDSSPSQLLRLDSPMLPQIRYQNLPLMEYLTAQLPEQILASPFDRSLLTWQEDPGHAVEQGLVPFSSGTRDLFPELATPDVQQLWPYGSSYQMVAAAWNPDDNSGDTKSWLPRQDTPHRLERSAATDAPHGQKRRYSEVAFPSNKVMLYEEFDRITKNGPRWSFADDAKVNVAFFDGSVRNLDAADFNPGASPEPGGTETFVQKFQPLGNYPSGMRAKNTTGETPLRFRWTRGGLGGIDIGGQEVRADD